MRVQCFSSLENALLLDNEFLYPGKMSNLTFANSYRIEMNAD
jgi:hypothetical protein